MRRLGVALLAMLPGGCASTPPVSELRSGVQSVTFIQYGTELAARWGSG